MTQSDVLTMFRQSGALLEGHFRLSSGLHSAGYLQCALVLQHPRHAEALGAALGNLVRPLGAATVLSPALGGIVIGQDRKSTRLNSSHSQISYAVFCLKKKKKKNKQ